MVGNVADAQAAEGWPTEDDRDRYNGDSGIGRRRYELVDGVHELQMINGGDPILFGASGKGLAKLGEQVRGT